MKESVFSRKVVEYLKSKGALVNVNTATIYDRVGRSDVEVCYEGHYIALELKTGNYQPDPLQIRYLEEVREVGGYGLLLRDTLDDLEDLLNYLDNWDTVDYVEPDLPEINYEELEVFYD
nr:MAG TPA: Nuclease [Caudoviricetes sp.]